MAKQGGAVNHNTRHIGRATTVLVVDDNPDHTTLASAALQRNGSWSVDVVNTLAGAFEKTRTGCYDLLLIDYCLPDGLGLDLIDWVRHDSAVVLMTGMGSEEVAAEAFKSGALDYLVKNTIFPQILPEVASAAVEKFRTAKQNGGTTWRRQRQQPRKTPRKRVGEESIDRSSIPDRMLQRVSRIREPIHRVLADPSAYLTPHQASRLKMALDDCDELFGMVKEMTAKTGP